ncbi:MAG TPA: hypothetical protein VFR78_11225 [Pyrinomonadaceae bacterium]|nr:hypothetical protein [Pyrinomonadaceae bacterium]
MQAPKVSPRKLGPTALVAKKDHVQWFRRPELESQERMGQQARMVVQEPAEATERMPATKRLCSAAQMVVLSN